MNVTLGTGKAVHLGHEIPGYATSPECGGNRATERYTKTSREVTCKKCLKIVAKLESATEITTEPVAADVATKTPTPTLDQIMAAVGATAPVDGEPHHVEIMAALIATDEENPKFEKLLDLEYEAKGSRASVMFAPAGLPDWLMAARHNAHRKAKVALYEAFDALAPDELAKYGEYRRASQVRYSSPEVRVTKTPVPSPVGTAVAVVNIDMQSRSSGIVTFERGQLLLGREDGRWYADMPYAEFGGTFRLYHRDMQRIVTAAVRRLGEGRALEIRVEREY